MSEPQYSLLADIQYDTELARQGKFALYGQRNIAREYRCKKATPEDQQAYETLQTFFSWSLSGATQKNFTLIWRESAGASGSVTSGKITIP